MSRWGKISKWWNNDRDPNYKEQDYKALRKLQLDQAVDKLVREHGWIAKIEDADLLLSLYVTCANLEEYRYCQKELRRIYYGGYIRYDNERLR